MTHRVPPNFNTALQNILSNAGFQYFIMFSALNLPATNNTWTINLPDNINELPWNKPNFRLVVHAQDFVRFTNTICNELSWLEQQLTPEQQAKTIFVYWDHDLNQCYHGLIKCVEFPQHSYQLINELKQRYTEWIDVLNKKYQYNWQCLNGMPRPHRDRVYYCLKDTSNGILSHVDHRPLDLNPYCNYDFDNVKNFVNLMPVYQSAKTNVVTETMYSDVGGIISEKTLFAIAAKQPFICIGHRNIHQQIRDRGFVTFDSLFDLSFDNQPSSTRLTQALSSNLPILSADIDLDQYRDQVEHNFEWLMTGYTDSMVQRAQDQLFNT